MKLEPERPRYSVDAETLESRQVTFVSSIVFHGVALFHSYHGLPAFVRVVDSYVAWFWYGRLHNVVGPARTRMHIATNEVITEWWVDGVQYHDKLLWAIAVADWRAKHPDESVLAKTGANDGQDMA